VSLQC